VAAVNELRWVTCFAARPDSGGNLDLLKVAVDTAQSRTRLPATVVLDDPGGLVESWLLSRGVEVIHWRSRWADRIEACRERHDRRALCSAFAPGTMLRLEMADIADHRGWDGRVLYTDHDIWFRSDPTPLLPQEMPHAVAACRESPAYGGTNAGVLLIDLERWRREWPRVRQWVDDRLDLLMSERARFGGVDQAVLNEAIEHSWMDQRLNGMPWWGDELYDSAAIVHLHGMKPHDRHRIASMPATMQQTAGGAYHRACADWDWLRDGLA
jgi:hypothetical protein